MPTRQQHNSTSDRLLRAGTLYHREAAKCLNGKAYFAASVMQVAVLEAALRAMCSIFAKDFKRTKVYQAKRFRRKRDKALDYALNLNDLINIARELGWFPGKFIVWEGRRTDLAGLAHEIQKIRNHVHADRVARARKDQIKFSKETFDKTYEVFEVANSWLLHHVQQDLLKRMQREQNRNRREAAKRA